MKSTTFFPRITPHRLLLAVPVVLAATACDEQPHIRVYDAPRPASAGQDLGPLSNANDPRPATDSPDASDPPHAPASPAPPAVGTQDTVAQPPASERPPIALRRFNQRGGGMAPFQFGPIRGAYPPHWSPVPPQPPRLATFAVRGENYTADLAITRFPGEVGSDLMNLNRWRNQVGLPPVESTDNRESVDFPFGDTTATLTLVANPRTGPDGDAILVASIPDPDQNHTWFVKLAGPARMIDAEHGPMLDFLERLQLPGIEPRDSPPRRR